MAIVWDKGYGPAISQAFKGLYGSMDRMDALDRQAAADRWRAETQAQQRAGWQRREGDWRYTDRLREQQQTAIAKALADEEKLAAQKAALMGNAEGYVTAWNEGDQNNRFNIDPWEASVGAKIPGVDASSVEGVAVNPADAAMLGGAAPQTRTVETFQQDPEALSMGDQMRLRAHIKDATGTSSGVLRNRMLEQQDKEASMAHSEIVRALQLDTEQAAAQERLRVEMQNSAVRNAVAGQSGNVAVDQGQMSGPAGDRWDDRTYLSILDIASKAKGPLKQRLYNALGVTWDDVNNAGRQNLQTGTLDTLRDASGSESLLEYVPGQEIEVADQDLALIPSQDYQLDPTRRDYEERNAAERAQKEALLAAEIEAAGLESARDRAAAKGAIAQAVSEGQTVLDPTEANIRMGLEEQNALAATRQRQANEAAHESKIAAGIRQHQARETAQANAEIAAQDKQDRKAQKWAIKARNAVANEQLPPLPPADVRTRLTQYKIGQDALGKSIQLPMSGSENANPAILENIALQGLRDSAHGDWAEALLGDVDRIKLRETFTQAERDTVVKNIWEAAWRLSQQHGDGSIGVTRSYFDQIIAGAENGEIDLLRTGFNQPVKGIEESYSQTIPVAPLSREQLQSNIANAMNLEYALGNQIIVGASEADALEQVELRPAGRYKMMYVLPNGQNISRWYENEPGID